MSFLDRIKGNGRKTDVQSSGRPGTSPFDELAQPNSPMEATMRLGPSTIGVAPSRLDNEDSSIISEAAPSEMAADFPESRHPGVDTEGFTTGLPVVGAWPLARQQRAMLGLFVGGFVLLLLVAYLALSASKVPNQPGNGIATYDAADFDRMIAELTSMGVTIVMTSELEDRYTDLRFSPFGSAFLADAIVVQRYIEIEGRFKRVISVIKVRGSAHSNDIRLFEITGEGIIIGETLSGMAGIMTGSPSVVPVPKGSTA